MFLSRIREAYDPCQRKRSWVMKTTYFSVSGLIDVIVSDTHRYSFRDTSTPTIWRFRIRFSREAKYKDELNDVISNFLTVSIEASLANFDGIRQCICTESSVDRITCPTHDTFDQSASRFEIHFGSEDPRQIPLCLSPRRSFSSRWDDGFCGTSRIRVGECECPHVSNDRRAGVCQRVRQGFDFAEQYRRTRSVKKSTRMIDSFRTHENESEERYVLRDQNRTRGESLQSVRQTNHLYWISVNRVNTTRCRLRSFDVVSNLS